MADAADAADVARLADGPALAGRCSGKVVVVTDVADAPGWARLADWLRSEHGRVDVLINNAGVAARDRLPDVDLAT